MVFFLAAPNTTFSSSLFNKVRDTLLEAGQDGPVLLHCGDGRRVGKKMDCHN